MIEKLLHTDPDYAWTFIRIIAGVIVFPYGMQKPPRADRLSASTDKDSRWCSSPRLPTFSDAGADSCWCMS